MIAKVVSDLTEAQKQQWLELGAEGLMSIVERAHEPHNWTSPLEIQQSVAQIGNLLQRFPYPPKLVTIARSRRRGEEYVPQELAPLIEWELLFMLRRLWPVV